ncbi:MAG: DUF4292 domain-containing protein [Muribaculaceae bacterium]|nr:DUF4292 domain-containing protein [Muribaculaceae bacterium]
MKRLLVAIFAILTVVLASAQEPSPLEKKEGKKVVEAVSSLYDKWETVELSGKLKMDMLPLSPSVKIFMQRDSVIRLSLRAPLLGEVGRAEICNDSVLVVNKMKKTYVKESLKSVLAAYPGTISDLQDILLGRVVIPGCGLLSDKSWKDVEVFQEEEAGFSLYPADHNRIEGVDYGYLIDSAFRTKALAILPKENVIAGVAYEFPDEGEVLTFTYQTDKRTITAELRLDREQWGVKGFEPVKINSRYRKLSFKDFLKSF